MRRITHSDGRDALKSLTDYELVNACREGVIEAFEEIVDRYQNQIVTYLCRYVGSREMAEDLAQETFLRVFRRAETYDPSSKFSTWIYTIAVNLAKDEFKRLRRRPQTRSMDDERAGEGIRSDSLRTPEGDEESPTGRMERGERSDRVNDLLARIPPEERDVLILRDINGFTYTEIADTLGLPMGTVKSRINRGRNSLKELLQRMPHNGLP